ncbi:MAG: hypothetical protein QM564_04455 [Bergeyella sp.]
MKNNNTLSVKILKPKKQTVDFLLKFSKSIAVIGNEQKKYVISKN